ncbi:MAG: YdcH family protein [Arenimonas sp.]
MNLVDHHPLILEFPEFREKIHALKISDKHFSNLFEEYEIVDKAVVRIENGIEPNTDSYLEEQKKNRLHLKDQLYAMLNGTGKKHH